MVRTSFRSMRLLDDMNTVKIIGDCLGHRVTIKISVLQLAKIFGTDKEVVQEVGDGFGSEEYEDRCDETREHIKRFPEIDVLRDELEFGYVSVEDETWAKRSADPQTIGIYAEDIVGWGNEGIRIDFPKEIFNHKLKGKKFRVLVSPFYAVLNPDKI